MGIYSLVRDKAQELGLTIAEVERRAGLSQGAIGKWQRSSPMLTNLFKVAAVLDVTPDELLGLGRKELDHGSSNRV